MCISNDPAIYNRSIEHWLLITVHYLSIRSQTICGGLTKKCKNHVLGLFFKLWREQKKYLNQMSMMDLGKWGIVEENLIIEYKPWTPFVHVFNIGINNSEITLWAICGLRCAIKGKQDTDRGYLEKVYLTSPQINKKSFNICCRVGGIVSVI